MDLPLLGEPLLGDIMIACFEAAPLPSPVELFLPARFCSGAIPEMNGADQE